MTIELIAGKYYSGKDSSCVEVSIRVSDAGELVIEPLNILPTAYCDVIVSSRVGNSTRYLELPDGARIETRANDEVDALQQRWTPSHVGLAHRLEHSMGLVVFAVIALFAGGYGFVSYGIPALSGVITAALPTYLDDSLGGEVLEQLDDLVFEPSELNAARQFELNKLFETLIPETQRNYRIDFRSSELLGANAFALPDAQVIFTDELIALSTDDDMMAAIMLHEIGHVVERHSMQSVVRQAGLSIAIVALTGDVNSAATTLLVLLPTVLIQSSYSRNLEWEADTYALEQMHSRGIDTNNFADIMERLMASHDEDIAQDNSEEDEEGEESDPLLEYFSTHPLSDERIQRFRGVPQTD